MPGVPTRVGALAPAVAVWTVVSAGGHFLARAAGRGDDEPTRG